MNPDILIIDDDKDHAEARINDYLERYYGQPAKVLRRWQACYAGPASEAAQWLNGYAAAGASHLMLRFAGDHERHLKLFAKIREELA